MALFSKLRGGRGASGNVSENIARSMVDVITLAAISDGSISEAEREMIGNMMSFSPIFHAIGAKRTVALVGESLRDLDKIGSVEMAKRAKATLAMPQRETALCFAMRVVLADGVLDENERKTIISLAQILEIGPDTFNKMFDVIAMLQRPAAA